MKKISDIFYMIGRIHSYLVFVISSIMFIDGIFALFIVEEKTLLATEKDDPLSFLIGIIFLTLSCLTIICARYLRKELKKDYDNKEIHIEMFATGFFFINMYYCIGSIFALITIYFKSKRKSSS